MSSLFFSTALLCGVPSLKLFYGQMLWIIAAPAVFSYLNHRIVLSLHAALWDVEHLGYFYNLDLYTTLSLT